MYRILLTYYPDQVLFFWLYCRALVVDLASVVVLVDLEHQLVQTMLKCNDFCFSLCSFGCH